MNRQNEPTAELKETSTDAPSNVEKEVEPSVLNHSNTNTYVLETGVTLNSARAIKNAIPEVIYNTLNPFFNAKDLQRLTGVVFRAKTSKLHIESYSDAFTDALLDVIRRYKEGTISNLDGYLYATIKRLSRRLFLAS
ncbi:hypothetical protein [Virgibacillus sp. DJP39]|uniref:hypothetical protein n=1 Tax=Virgibacillus sp. DJP39 TaxID=3409790 RepID=UPI003BB6E7E1